MPQKKRSSKSYRPIAAVSSCALFKFQCRKLWESLTPTRDTDIRFCDECHHAVYFCHSMSELRQHASNGHCAAIANSAFSTDLVPDTKMKPLMGIPAKWRPASPDPTSASTKTTSQPHENIAEHLRRVLSQDTSKILPNQGSSRPLTKATIDSCIMSVVRVTIQNTNCRQTKSPNRVVTTFKLKFVLEKRPSVVVSIEHDRPKVPPLFTTPEPKYAGDDYSPGEDAHHKRMPRRSINNP